MASNGHAASQCRDRADELRMYGDEAREPLNKRWYYGVADTWDEIAAGKEQTIATSLARIADSQQRIADTDLLIDWMRPRR
jgi:hypothetical protein